MPSRPLTSLHQLPAGLLHDDGPTGARILSFSRAALLCSSTWATVSRSYLAQLLATSTFAPLLRQMRTPWAQWDSNKTLP